MISGVGVEEWSVLVPLAVALGLDFYLVVLALALLPFFPGIGELPGTLNLLSTPSTIGAAAFLYLFGWGMERHRFPLLLWQTANLLVRIVGAGLLATLVSGEAGAGSRNAAIVAAALIAGGVQALRMGWGTILDHGEAPIPRRSLRSAAEDAFALGVLWMAVTTSSPWTLLATLAILLPALWWSRPALRAALFSFRLVRGVALSIGGGTGWHSPERFPRWLRRSLQTGRTPIGFGLRGTPAALSGGSGIGRFRTGWLVVSGEGPAFHFRTLTGIWEAGLAEGEVHAATRRSDVLLLRLEEGDRLFVPRGGPGLDSLRAEFAP